MKSIVDYALEYEKLGFFVLPIDPVLKKPVVKWENRRDRKPDPQEITKWFKRFPDARVGIATGEYSGVDVVDLDGPEAIEKYIAMTGEISETIKANTGREEGGIHLYFKFNGNGLKNHQGGGIDLRTTNGIIVLAPSPHKSGKSYQWDGIDPIEHGLDDLLEMPPELVEYFHEQKKGNPHNAENPNPLTLEPVSPGERDGTLEGLSVGGSIRVWTARPLILPLWGGGKSYRIKLNSAKLMLKKLSILFFKPMNATTGL